MLKATVRDTGIGIKKQDMGKLFQSFQQVDSKRNRNIEGTGLGLAITKQLLRLMNGSVRIESEYEKGSTFYIELPQKIIDPAPSVPVPDNTLKAALIIDSRYVFMQTVKDLTALGIGYINLEKEGSLDNIKEGYIITEKHLFSDRIKQTIADNPNLRCLIIAPFESPNDINLPRVKMLHKPVYSLGLYSALGLGADISIDGDSSEDNFRFIAPDAHILIVDDNPINLTVASGILEPLKMKIDTATGALETIEKVKKVKYDVVFMDHMMPEVDGVETTHIIRRLIVGYEDVPIIALTANAIGGTKEMFLREGMNDFVAKPIEVKDIVAVLRKWLPKEKIVPVDVIEETKAPAVKEEGLSIDGLNTKEALSLLGSEKLYMQVLKEYYLAIDKRARILTDAIQKKDIKGYTIEVHSLKSTSKQIGAESLSALALRLEKAGNDGDFDFILGNTDDLIMQYMALKDILEPIFPDVKPGAMGKRADSSVLKDLLDEMADALEAMDTLLMDEVLEKMEHYSYDERQSECFIRLKAAAEECDIDECSAVINAWKQLAAANDSDSVTDTARVKALLDKLEKALQEFDTLLIDEAVEEMEKMHFTDKRMATFLSLKKAAEKSDIELCSRIVEKWKKSL